MRFHKQFDHFDPLKGTAYFFEFPSTSAIAARARTLLHGRTNSDIHVIADDADSIVESFFDQELHESIQMLKDQGRTDLLDIDEDGHCSGVLEEAHQDFDIRTDDNTSYLEALQEGFRTFFDSDHVKVPNLKEYEYYAAMALWFIGDFVMAQKYHYDFQRAEFVARGKTPLDASDVARCGRILIDAMEAVCYAERLREVERTQKRYEERIQEIQAKHQSITEQDIQQIQAEVARQLQEEAREQHKQRSMEGNRIRHEKNHNVKKLVLDMWEKNPTQFPSAEKAGAHYVDLLKSRNIEREHRTVVGWIRSRAKELKIRFR